MPLQTPLDAHFVLEWNEFSKAARIAQSHLPQKVKWAGYAQFGLLLALMLTAIAYRPDGKTQPISLVIFILVWLVFFAGFISHRAWIELRFAPMKGEDIWYEFGETGFRCGLLDSESKINWPAIHGFVETDALFVVLASGLLFYTIPKRALATDDTASLRKLLEEKVTRRA